MILPPLIATCNECDGLFCTSCATRERTCDFCAAYEENPVKLCGICQTPLCSDCDTFKQCRDCRCCICEVCMSQSLYGKSPGLCRDCADWKRDEARAAAEARMNAAREEADRRLKENPEVHPEYPDWKPYPLLGPKWQEARGEFPDRFIEWRRKKQIPIWKRNEEEAK